MQYTSRPSLVRSMFFLPPPRRRRRRTVFDAGHHNVQEPYASIRVPAPNDRQHLQRRQTPPSPPFVSPAGPATDAKRASTSIFKPERTSEREGGRRSASLRSPCACPALSCPAWPAAAAAGRCAPLRQSSDANNVSDHCPPPANSPPSQLQGPIPLGLVSERVIIDR